MSIKVYTVAIDEVISSAVLTGETTYGFALEKIYPLVNRFSAQRELQNPKFYERLKDDLLKGCLMPPITLAMISEAPPNFTSPADAQAFANGNIEKGYVLDGLQRLNILNSVKDNEGFDRHKPLYLSIIVSTSKDSLLYRMITLNNGQRPMTPRHQIEVLTEELFNFKPENITILTEKDRSEQMVRGAFTLANISRGYMAYITNNVHNENNKIISEKMDEIIVRRIMDAGVNKDMRQFQEVLNLIDRLAENTDAKKWLKTANNLIGFCVGIKESFDTVNEIQPEHFGDLAKRFDAAFNGINVAKVNLGKYRRELSKDFVAKINKLGPLDQNELLAYFSEQTAS